MEKVSSEFYRNVLLLTKFVAPHDDFKKHFKEGMFDKPNTLGFIHVSYYLLSIYYKDKPKVQWPVICKQTENKFRNDVRECLMVFSSENADLNFPPIFASHLLLARGTKFLLIMWKFSLMVLRTYLKNKYHCNLTTNPKPGPCVELTKTFLTNDASDNMNDVSQIRKERENVEEKAKSLLKKKSEEQNFLKAEILKLREELKKVINDAPVNAAAKKNLSVIEKNEIIDMWTNYISDSLKSLGKEVESLKDECSFLKSITDIVSIIKGDSVVLNTRNLDSINIEPIYQLVPPEMQVLPYSLYSEGNLNLQNFFTVFKLLLQKCKLSREKGDPEKFSSCEVQLKISNEDLKTAIHHFENLHEEIKTFHFDDVKKTEELNETQGIISSVPEFDKVLFMSSPSINIVSEEEQNFNQNYLQLTPVEGVHKELFSRHIFSSDKNMLSVKKPHLVQRINFDDSAAFESSKLDHNTSIDKQSLSRNRSTLKKGDKYSKIFSTRNKKHDNRVNKSIMNMMLPLMTKQHSISLMNSCNLSQDISQDSLLIDANLSSTIDPLKAEDKEKGSQPSNKRRSISDLVERYKKILQERDSK